MVTTFALPGRIFPVKARTDIMSLRNETLAAGNMLPYLPMSVTTATANIRAKRGHNSAVYDYSKEDDPVTDHVATKFHQVEYQLQEAVRRIKKIMASRLKECCHVEELVMIDAIQRLGLECHLQDDICAVLRKHYERDSSMDCGDNLHDVALRFRLLRQEGYNLPAVVFNKFKDKDGKFRKELTKDIKGLMSLFEASHLSIPGDDILKEAGEFSAHYLKKLKSLEQSEAAHIIGSTLSKPYHKSLPRLTAKNFLHDFEISLKLLHDCIDKNQWINELKNLAKLDIHMAQISYQGEITHISRWWKELWQTEELKLARVQPAKWHMWSLVALPSPSMTQHRIDLTKAIAFVYIIDDIFDVYGTIEELSLFSEAVNRWECADVKGLPNHMVVCLKALRDTTDEMSQKIYEKHGWNPKGYLQKAWAELCNAFLQEAKWFASGHLPTAEEYLKNGRLSTGQNVIYVYIFLLLDEGLDLNRTDLLNSNPDIASLGATILRLWDDLGSAKDENQDGHDGSYITCYMNEYNGSAESAREYVISMIADTWKSLNQTCLSPSPFSADFKTAVLNLARMVSVMYSYDDNHSLPGLEKDMN